MLPQLEEIQKKRRKLGLRQAELAKLAGVSQSLIAKLESGRVSPSYENARAIFEALERLEEKEQGKARDILTRNVMSISRREPLSKAILLMKKNEISQLPVLDGHNVVGSVSEQTILNKLAGGIDPSKLSSLAVENVMDESFPRIDEDTPLPAVSALLRYNPAVLTAKKGKITGIITKADLFKVVHK